MALNEQMQQMVQQDIQDAETRPKEEILKEQMEGLKTVGRTARDIAVESIPGVSEALAEKRVDEALQRGDTTGAMIEGAAGLMGAVPMFGDAAAKGLRAVAAPFKKTRKAYKVAVQADDKKLYPLFVNADKELPVGTWIEAEFPKSSFKGKRTANSEEKYYVPTKGAKRTKGEKAKNTGDPIIIPDEATRKNLIDEGFITDRTKRTKEAPYGKVTAVAARPGLHASQAPVATHIGPQDLKVSKDEVDKLLEAGVTPEAIKRRGNQYYVKRRAEDQVFIEVEMADDVDYQSMLAKEGKTDINDYVPRGGSYRYSDGQADSDQWVVGGDMKITRVLSREEAKQAQKEAGVVDLPYRDEVEEIIGRKFSDKAVKKPVVKLEKFEPAKVSAINKSWWLDGDTVTLYHGTNKRNLKNISDKGLEPDAEGFVYLTPDPNTAAGYAAMSGSGGEKAFRKSGKAKHTPEEERVILKYEIPKEEFLKYLDMTKQRHNPSSPNYNPDQDKLFNKDVFDKHIKSEKAEDYYATTEVRFPDSGVFDKYLTAVSNRKNALKSDEIKMAKGGIVMDDYQLAKITDEPQNFAKGGMTKQMELFEPVERGYAEGGLMDEGGMVDEESGNEVPPGSLREEVRDDIPAQLSEGEFVFPADVVRYIGLEKLMMMRQQAKMGLRMMEEMGQMGNGDEATVPDDLPFDMYDLDIEDEEEYNDKLEMQAGGMVPTYNPKTGTYSIPGSGLGGYQAPQVTTTGYTPYGGIQPYTQPLQYTGTQYTTAEQTSNIPTFGEMVGRSPGQYDEFRTYVNDAGQTLQIPFKDGKPLYPIPEGYSEKTEEVTTEVAPIEQRVQTTQLRYAGDKDDADKTPTGGTIALGGEAVGKPKGGGIPFTRYAGPSRKTVGATIMDVSFDIPGFNPLTGFGQFAKNMLSSDPEAGLPEDGTAFINVKGGAPNAHKVSIPSTDYNKLRNDVTGDLAKDYQSAAKLADALANGTYSYDSRTGRITDIKGNNIDINNLPDDLARGIDKLGESISRNVKEDMDGGMSIAEAGKNLTDSEKAGLSMYNDKQFSDFFATDDGTRADTGKDDTAPSTPSAPDTYSDPYEGGYGSEDNSSSNDAGSDPDDGSNPICLTENMKVKLNGVIDFVTNVKVGDIVDNTVVTEVLHKHMREGYYVVNGELQITNDHPVLANGSWKRTEDLVLGDYINDVEVTSLEYVEQVTPTVYIGTADDRYDVYTKGEVYTVHGQYKNITKQAA